jgi:peptidoglycan/LPS O-acetylase OafA/YrhL
MSSRPAAPTRYLYLDGIRGLAALYVVLFHIRLLYDPELNGLRRTGLLGKAILLLDAGHYAVPVFIVLSGFCLMLPLAIAGRTDLPGGTKRYLIRRARRILPPYYAALAVSLLAVGLIPKLRDMRGVVWNQQLPSFSVGGILSHLLLIHDLLPRWRQLIDVPMWSVAIEWHIYFLFPWLLLPLLRRIGIFALFLVTTAASIVLNRIAGGSLSYFSPQFLALFVAGMAAAMTVAPPGDGGGVKWRVLDHPLLFWCVIAGTLICMFRFTFIVGGEVYRGDLLIGSAAAVSIAHLGIRTRARSLIVRILESPPLVWLGTISYSLYLIHFPLLPLFIGSVRSSSNRRRFTDCQQCVSPAVRTSVDDQAHKVAQRRGSRRRGAAGAVDG